jgi:hypothetical protein
VLKNKSKLIILIFANVSFTLFTYRSIFAGKLLGDPFDSRLHIILHEHWWRWFNGLVSFRDTEFFYPFDKALGFSDVFFTQGIIYSIFRFIGYSLPTSWTLTTILLLIIGNIGWVFVAKKYIKNYILQLLIVLTFVSSLSFVYYFTFNPNIVGYSYLSWIALFINNIIEEKNSKNKNRKISSFITLLLIYALSCWYGAFFVILIIIARALLEVMFNFESFIQSLKKIKFIVNIRQYLIQLPIQIYLVWLFTYVYVSVVTQPNRPTDELFRNSPRISLLPNGSNVDGTKLSGSIFKDLYLLFGLDFEKEYGIGIGVFTLLLGIFVTFYGIVKKLFSKNQKLWMLTFLGVYLYFVVYLEKFSFHQLFFENVPGFNSIRCPSRYVIILGFFVIFGIFYTFDSMLNKSNKIKIGVVFLSLILLIDQYRSPFKGWDPSVLINTDLMSQKDEIKKNCDYFYYDFPGGWWYDQIEAMTFAIQVGVPTVNGYTGAFPVGYPTESFTSNEEPLKIFDWISKIDPQKRGCFVTGRSEIKSLNGEFDSIDFIGFTEIETNGSASWRWAVSPNPYLYILSNSDKKKNISFTLNTSKCNPVQEISILDGQGNSIEPEKKVTNSNTFQVEVDMRKAVIRRIQIITDSGGCQLGNDPRILFFEIKDFKISTN